MKEPKDYKKVAVIGAGMIGHSWAVVFAKSGLQVSLYNRMSNTYGTALARVKKALEFLASEGVITEKEIDNSLDRIILTDNLNEAIDAADYIQECLWEDLQLKQNMFKRLSELTPPDVAIGSSCSGLRITDIAAKVEKHPERCIVAHPTNPPHLIPFMEISGDNSDQQIKDSVFNFMEYIGQKPIQCKEVYGYVLNRIQLSLIQESIYLVKEGICSVEAVERAVTDGLGLRWAFTGPYGVEELNSVNLEEGLIKYKDYMIEFFVSQQKKVYDYDLDFVKSCVEGFKPVMQGKTHDEYLLWRDCMVTRTRILKEKS